ncbi:methyltransferase family protein [Thalassotalea fusca]
MKFLELRIPPLLLMLLFAAIMWLIAQATPSFMFLDNIKIVLLIIAVVIAVVLTLAGALEFRRAQTTVNPTAPESTSSLVTSGIYQFTRNPMYVGFFTALIGWGCFLSNAYALIFALLFVPYMNKFQILPEEQMLTQLFGQQFKDYCQSVRRWC